MYNKFRHWKIKINHHTISNIVTHLVICDQDSFLFDYFSFVYLQAANTNSVRLNREALKLLRALAGHDAVKAHIVQQGVAPVLKELLQTHMVTKVLLQRLTGP